MSITAQNAIADCYRILNRQPCRYRNLWTQSAVNERKIFCIIAAIPSHLADSPWDKLNEEQQSAIRMRVAGMHRWLNQKLRQVNEA